MDIQNLIRSGIFLTVGLIVLTFPKQTLKFQRTTVDFMVKKLHLKFMVYLLQQEDKKILRTNKISSIIFIIISVILFVYSVNN